jgi:transcriptional regulator with XRE-family HTH domain
MTSGQQERASRPVIAEVAVDFAEVLDALMDERDISGRALARRCNCDQSLISRYRSGKVEPSLTMAKLLDAALDAGGVLVELADPGRRALLKGGLVAGGLLAIGPEAASVLTWAQRHPPQVDRHAVDALTELLAAQRRADDALGSAAMVRPALAHLSVVENLVRQSRGPVRPALLNVAQQWAQFGGWLCRNATDYAAADIHIGHSLGWAEEIGDSTMISTALTNRSEIAVYCGEPGATVGLAQAAQRDKRASPGQRAHGAQFEARGHAMTGDSDAAERKLGEAQEFAAELAEQPGELRPWSYWMTPEFFRNEEGITCTYLAADPRWHARAVTLLEVPDETAGIWSSAQNLAYLASAHAQAGEVDQACAAAVHASAVVRRSGSARYAALLTRIHADLQASYPHDAGVAELADAIA